MGTDTTPPSESTPEPDALPPGVSSHILTGSPSIRSMAAGGVTHISDTPLTLRTVASIFSNSDQPQPQLPRRPPPHVVDGGPAEPPYPPPTNNDQVLTSVRIDTAVGVGIAAGAGAASAAARVHHLTADDLAVGSPISRNLSRQPEHVAAQTRLFVEAIRRQLAAMSPTPNEPDKLDFIEFLEGLAAGLSELAETLDKMVANRGNANEPILLGKAATIANHLGIGAMDYIAKNREKLAGMMIQVGFYGAVTLLAMSLGIDKEFFEAIAKIFGKGSK